MWKQTRVKPKGLTDIPELPPELAYLWAYYREVQGGESLTYAEIESWSRLTRKNVDPTEVSILRQIDIRRWNATAKANTKPDGHNRTSSNPG